MESLKKFTDQFQATWRQLSRSGQIGISVTAVLCLLAIGGIGFWSSQPQWIELQTGLTPQESGAITTRLEGANIQYKFNHTGSTILVPKSKLATARIEAGEYLAATPAQSTNDSWFLTADRRVMEERLTRQRENLLAETIMRIRSVKTATVSISMQERGPFSVVNSQNPTTANVVVEPHAGTVFSQVTAQSIAGIMASSVPGLTPDNVTVVDNDGRMYVVSADGGSVHFADNYQYKMQLETDLQAKAERVLADLLGDGRYSVQVASAIDFTQVVEESTTYQNGGAKSSETIVNNKSTGGNTEGPAGVSANQASTKAKVTPVIREEETVDTAYDNDRSQVKTIRPAGDLTRMTVSVVVDLSAPEQQPGQPAPVAPTATLKDIEEIVKAAVAFDEVRGDQIQVVDSKLSPNALAATPVVPPATDWEFVNELVRNGSLGIAALVALVLGLLIIRKMKPITLPGTTGVSVEQAHKLSELSSLASDNPDAVADVVSAWLNKVDKGSESLESPAVRKAA